MLALVVLSAASVQAGGNKVEVLGDRQLASVEGGYLLLLEMRRRSRHG